MDKTISGRQGRKQMDLNSLRMGHEVASCVGVLIEVGNIGQFSSSVLCLYLCCCFEIDRPGLVKNRTITTISAWYRVRRLSIYSFIQGRIKSVAEI